MGVLLGGDVISTLRSLSLLPDANGSLTEQQWWLNIHSIEQHLSKSLEALLENKTSMSLHHRIEYTKKRLNEVGCVFSRILHTCTRNSPVLESAIRDRSCDALTFVNTTVTALQQEIPVSRLHALPSCPFCEMYPSAFALAFQTCMDIYKQLQDMSVHSCIIKKIILSPKVFPQVSVFKIKTVCHSSLSYFYAII